MSPEFVPTGTTLTEKSLIGKTQEILLLRKIKKLGNYYEKNQARLHLSLGDNSYKLDFIPGKFLPVVCAQNDLEKLNKDGPLS